MAGFIYFIEDVVGTPTNQTLIAAGLSYAILGAGPESRQCNGGPGGAAGMIITAAHPDASRQPEAMYLPAKQTWRRHHGGKFWVGFENERPPAPEDLERERTYEGQPVTFDNGSVWIVPRCYGAFPKRRSTLPTKLNVDESGKWVMATQDRFVDLCDRAMRLWRKAIGVDKEPNTVGESIEGAVAALAVNYRVADLEMSQLGWTSDDVTRVCRAMIDLDEIERLARETSEKKIDAAAASATT